MNQPSKTQDNPQDEGNESAVDAIMVTMTEARRTFKAIAQQAADGKIVVITKQGIPFLQLVPLKYQVQQPTGGMIQPGPIGGLVAEE